MELERGLLDDEVLLEDSRRAERDAGDVALGKALLDEPIGSASGSDELLAAGAAGLRFFDMFGPLYSKHIPVPFDVEREIYNPYRRLAGMDFAALRRDSTALKACGQSLAESTGVLRSSFGGLAGRWRGHAASNATDHVGAVLDIASLLDEDTAAVGRACGHLADALEGVVRSYALAALSLHSPTCATGSPALVGSLIEFAEYQARSATAAQRIARQILDEDFVPTFEERLRVFREEVVARYEDDIRATWSEFQEATSVQKVPENPFAGVSPVLPGAAGPPAVRPATVHPLGVARDTPVAPDADGIGAVLADGPVTTRAASIGRTDLSGVEPAPGVALPDDGGAALGDAGPGGASLGSVADRDSVAGWERGGDGGTPSVRRELDGSGEYRERSGGGWHLPTELFREQGAREKLRNALAEERPTC